MIAGHGRLLAARKLGMTTVPTIELSHLTAAQKRAYVIVDNKSALEAGWDSDLLALELGELNAEAFDLTLTGFDLGKIGALFADPEPAPNFTTVKTVECPKCHRAFSP